MNRFLGIAMAMLSVLVMGCEQRSSGGDPKKIAQAFYEALDSRDYEKAKSMATKESQNGLDLLNTMYTAGKAFTGNNNQEPPKKADKLEWGDAIIEGTTAVVPLKVNGENRDIKLKQEEGIWKVAMDKNNMNKTGLDSAALQVEPPTEEELKQALEGLENGAIKGLENINRDSLNKALEKAGKVLQQAGEALQNLPQ